MKSDKSKKSLKKTYILVVYYYLHNDTKHHFCYLFEQNSIDEKVIYSNLHKYMCTA